MVCEASRNHWATRAGPSWSATSPPRQRGAAVEPWTSGCVEDVGLAVRKGQVQLQVADVGIAADHVRVRPRTVRRRGSRSQRQDAAGSLDGALLRALDGAVRRRLALGESVLAPTVRLEAVGAHDGAGAG